MIEINIIENSRSWHEDLRIVIPNMSIRESADTHDFALAIQERGNLSPGTNDIRLGIVQLLRYWNAQIAALDVNRTIHLPIDFSDQYTGCLQVQRNLEGVKLAYGYSAREGWSVDPLDPGAYSSSIRDFKKKSGPAHPCSIRTLSASINFLIEKFQFEM